MEGQAVPLIAKSFEGQAFCPLCDKTYLPAGGWWGNKKYLDKIRRNVKNMIQAGFPTDPETYSGLLVPKWSHEKWFCCPYTRKQHGQNDYESDSDGDGYSEDDSDAYFDGLDIEDIMELRAQGVNPWDEDAIVSIIHLTLVERRTNAIIHFYQDVLRVLRGM